MMMMAMAMAMMKICKLLQNHLFNEEVHINAADLTLIKHFYCLKSFL